VLANEFVLTHRVSFPDKGSSDQSRKLFRNHWTPQVSTSNTVSSVPPVSQNFSSDKKGKVTCFYCHKVGHKISECNALKKSAKPVGLVGREPLEIHAHQQDTEIGKGISKPVDVGDNYTAYALFITSGFVSLPGQEEKVSLRILRDTGASQSFLLEGVLPLSDQTATGKDVLIRGIEMTFLKVPLHKVHLISDLITGDVIVGVQSSLPVPGISFILGNDLAQGNVWGTSTSKPVPSTVVVSSPMSADVPDECGQKFPHVFPSCAVTRARTKQLNADQLCEGEVSLHPEVDGETVEGEQIGMTLAENISDFFSEESVFREKAISEDLLSSIFHVSREELIQEQFADVTLKPLFSMVRVDRDIETQLPSGYFLKDGMLLRRWVSKSEPVTKVYVQVVVPLKFRQTVIGLAHDGVAGHKGVRSQVEWDQSWRICCCFFLFLFCIP